MLGGRGRIEAYARAIATQVNPGDRVVDLGTGTGVLALLAARAGAAVYAIEDTPAVELARTFAEANGVSDRITIIARPSTRTSLSQPADALVTDTYDSFGPQGGLLGAVIDARRRLLREDAVLIPNRMTLHVAPLSAPAEHSRLLEPWDEEVKGLDFTAGRSLALNGLQPLEVQTESLAGDPAAVIDVDLRSATQTTVSGKVRLRISRSCSIHGLAGWFEAALAPGVVVSNAPGSTTTPYVQAWLPVETPMAADAGDLLDVEIHTDDGAGWRWELRLFDGGGVRQKAMAAQSTDRCFPG